jgi:6-phosphogluconolactonase (cycloisomerase 2 family)
MKISKSAGIGFAATALLATSAVVSSSSAQAATLPSSHRATPGPVFVQNDDVHGNAVIAYQRSASGRLTEVGKYATGGDGGVLAGSVVDHLASQGSLSYDPVAKLLYAVNAGSNTVTSFAVDGNRLVRRQVVASGGDFPVSVAVHGNLVYVLNAREGGSIQGYRRVGQKLHKIRAWHRDLGLDASATPEFTHTPGQIAFTPDGTRLVVTTKANGNAVDVFAVNRYGVAAKPTVNSVDGAVPFAVAFDQSGDLVATEAGPNAVGTFRIGAQGRLTALTSSPTGQMATCWIVATGGKVYVANAGSGTLSGYRTGSWGRLSALGNTTTDAGTVDAAVTPDGEFLYVQTGGAGLVDEFRVNSDGSLTALGSVTVPDAVGGEGIVAL